MRWDPKSRTFSANQSIHRRPKRLPRALRYCDAGGAGNIEVAGLDIQNRPADKPAVGDGLSRGKKPEIAHLLEGLDEQRSPNPKRQAGRGSAFQTHNRKLGSVNPHPPIDQVLALMARMQFDDIAFAAVGGLHPVELESVILRRETDLLPPAAFTGIDLAVENSVDRAAKQAIRTAFGEDLIALSPVRAEINLRRSLGGSGSLLVLHRITPRDGIFLQRTVSRSFRRPEFLHDLVGCQFGSRHQRGHRAHNRDHCAATSHCGLLYSTRYSICKPLWFAEACARRPCCSHRRFYRRG